MSFGNVNAKKLEKKLEVREKNLARMVKKCFIPDCNPNYRNKKGERISKKKVPVFRLPQDPAECSSWMKSIPYVNLTVSKDTVICEDHWQKSYPTVSKI